MSSRKPAEKPPSFEEAVQELEEITRALESGSLSLENSIKAYERGMELRSVCLELLEQAEQKLEIVERTHQGKLQQRPFQAGGPDKDPSDLFGRPTAEPDPADPPF